MTANELFAWMEGMNPSPYTAEQKTLWLNDLEAALWTEVFLQPAGLWKGRTEAEGDRPLLLPENRRMLYAMYLWAMMDFARGEHGNYANSMALYNDHLAQLQCWYAENYAPAMNPAVWSEWATCAYDGSGEPRCVMAIPAGHAVLGAECRITAAGDLQSVSLGTEDEPEGYMPAGVIDLGKTGPSRSFRFTEPYDRAVYAHGEGTGTVRFRLLLQPDAHSKAMPAAVSAAAVYTVSSGTGQAGAPGADGQDGADGASAYEIAVANGFEGTETEWLASLKGEKGDTGPAGADGADGADGATGADGADGGYYVPTVTQVDEYTAKVSFAPSKDGMTEAAEQTIALPPGADGVTPVFTIGEVTTLAAGEAATATITGTAENPVLNLGVPQGASAEAETETVLSDNLFNKAEAALGGVFYYGSSGYQLVTEGDSYYAYVTLRGAGVYRTKWNNSQHESTGGRIALLDGDNNWVANAEGTVTATDSNYAADMEFTVTTAHITAGVAKIAFDCHSTIIDTVMIVKDMDYPAEYIPYGYIEVATDSGKKQDNVLCEKTAVFLGDSICAGTTVDADSGYYNYGWGGIIGENNRMTWTNYGMNGGTVTELEAVQESRWLTTQATTAASEHPAADYVIFEGGCNDADQMKDDGLGEIASDYATFDAATFSGALESLILQLVTAFPTAKIGYIIPQKMYAQNDHTAAGHVHRRFFDRAIEICEKWGVPYIDLWKQNPLNPKLDTTNTFYTDGQHLTLAGYQRITPQIEAWMRSL